MVLCGASAYTKKYYLNDVFEGLPQAVKDELQIMCVLFTEDVGGVFTLVFDEDGSLYFETHQEEDDILYDEIGSRLKIKKLREEKKDLLEGLELYYQTFLL